MIYFYIVFIALIFAEIIKGLSTNGTPPVLQKYPWQLNLAWFMWKNILYIRIILLAVLLLLVWQMSLPAQSSIIIDSVIFTTIWASIYWLFNLFWIGKYKFAPLNNPTFARAAQNEIPQSVQVIGLNRDGVQKSYPVSMLFYHHQLSDTIGSQPIWVTYCGLCRSGRVYDRCIDGQALEFTLVGAITYNAIFQDHQSGSWWRQETGEAVNGPFSGIELKDIPMEQMTLAHWLAQYPDSEILQYHPQYQKKYDFLTSLMNYQASLPRWHRQKTPPLVIGLEINGHSKAYDWDALKKRRMVMDAVGDNHLLLISSEDGSSPFAYDRAIDAAILQFEINGDQLTDTNTRSTWNIFGYCIEGQLQGTQLRGVQIYQQFIRAWASFHPHSTYYDFLSSNDK